MYFSCNLGFFIHFSSVFLANLVVLHVYGQEKAIRAKTRQFGAKMARAAKNWQQAGAAAPAVCLDSRNLLSWHWTAEVAALVVWILQEIANFHYNK